MDGSETKFRISSLSELIVNYLVIKWNAMLILLNKAQILNSQFVTMEIKGELKC